MSCERKMYIRNLIPYIVFTCILALTSCTDSSPVDVTSPNPKTLDGTTVPVLVSDWDENGNPSGGIGLLGAYHVSVDIDSLTGEMTSLRNTASQDVVEIVDITNFLMASPCTSCVELKSIMLNNSGNLVLRIGIKHPFAFPNPAKPISGRNRADLHVFNVEGTVYMQTLTTEKVTFPGIGETAGSCVLVNADGYSDYLDTAMNSIIQTEATVHPYILHFDDFSEGNFNVDNPYGFLDIVNPSGYLVMMQGSSMDFKNYEFDIEELSNPFAFTFVVGCTYGLSAESKSKRMDPVYSLPQFNKKAASKVWLSGITNSLPYGLQEGDINSSEVYEISVLDMNHGVLVGNAKNKMKYKSDIASITLEIPQIMSTPITITNPIPTGGNPKDKTNPLTYELTVTNALNKPAGEYSALVKVVDSYRPGTNEVIPADGISRVKPTEPTTLGYFDIAEFATYTYFIVDVAGTNVPPTACFTVIPNFSEYTVPIPLEFDASCSSDTDGSILMYEWDFDYVPANGFIASGVEGSFVLYEFDLTTVGTRTIACKATDDGLISDIDTVSINLVESSVLTFDPNQMVLDNACATGMPVGFHYSDSHYDSVEAICPTAGTNYNIMVVRSSDGGNSFESPTNVNDVLCPLSPGDVQEGVSLGKLDNNETSVVWLNTNLNSNNYHDITSSGIFGSDVNVDNPASLLPSQICHAVSGNDAVLLTYSAMKTDASPWHLDINFYYSTDVGVFETWNDDPIYITEESGSAAGADITTCSIATDDNSTLHAVYIYDIDPAPLTFNGEMRYTKSNYPYTSFTPYIPLGTIPGATNLFYSLSVAASRGGQDIYVAYKSNDSGVNNIRLIQSHDGGSSFSASTVIDDVATINCDQPCLVTDYFGRVYVAYIEQPSGTDDVKVRRSLNHGSTWDPSVTVNTLISADRLAPTITVDNSLRIHVFWKDSRNDLPPTPVTYQLYYAQGE